MAEFKEFFFDSNTGVNSIRAIKCIPSCAPKAVVQIAHGIADHIDRYKDFMSYLADKGFVAVGNDHLGHGHSIRHPIEQGFFAYNDGWTHAVDDLHRLSKLMRNEYPNIPYIFFGHSMGSFLIRTYIIRYPNSYDAVIISGTGHMPKAMIESGYALAAGIAKVKGAKHVSKLIDKIAFGSYNKQFSPFRTKFDWISRDRHEVDKYAADPFCGFIATASLFTDMMGGLRFITDKENIAKININKPVYFMSGDMDPVGENGKGVERAYKAFCDAGVRDVYMKLYPGGRHEMLNEINREEVYMDISQWIESKI
ncbi:MAG: lysophospholipase [Oscillospiraceae bacterium]|nr:lysophospholipase [Oscillospiraceae bacterium]